jgi:Nickel responsive protein SCO4226-like
MPTFLDHHAMPEPSPEMREGMASRLRAGAADEHGVTGLNVYLADGAAYCVTEAPDADAVVRSHEAVGVSIRREDVVEVRPVI